MEENGTLLCPSCQRTCARCPYLETCTNGKRHPYALKTQKLLKQPPLAEGWLPPAAPRRIVLHWTEGEWEPARSERERYHFLIDGDAHLHKGDFDISANDELLDDQFAAHTPGANKQSVGLAVCGMIGATREPIMRAGRCPVNRKQIDLLLLTAAQIAQRYQIPPYLIVLHGEVEARWEIYQNGAWDLMQLPFDLAGPQRRFKGVSLGYVCRTRIADLLGSHPALRR